MCILCKTVISRGGVASKTFTTYPINNHLSYKHREEYKPIVSQRSATNEKSAVGTKSSVNANIQMMNGSQKEDIGNRQCWGKQNKHYHRQNDDIRHSALFHCGKCYFQVSGWLVGAKIHYTKQEIFFRENNSWHVHHHQGSCPIRDWWSKVHLFDNWYIDSST